MNKIKNRFTEIWFNFPFPLSVLNFASVLHYNFKWAVIAKQWLTLDPFCIPALLAYLIWNLKITTLTFSISFLFISNKLENLVDCFLDDIFHNLFNSKHYFHSFSCYWFSRHWNAQCATEEVVSLSLSLVFPLPVLLNWIDELDLSLRWRKIIIRHFLLILQSSWRLLCKRSLILRTRYAF